MLSTSPETGVNSKGRNTFHLAQVPYASSGFVSIEMILECEVKGSKLLLLCQILVTMLGDVNRSGR